ncbi:Uncharacterised protein [Legionella busanensis]|uniref:Uncharacterized protein n=1 Tax=Legionella busanensis TaxID=190655 RepID=A0A378JJP1_9GAMM|nr:hypothetical protein [Legionella busanensis]STX50429.1 Uncharacterised protein [Legionella busanensis]
MKEREEPKKQVNDFPYKTSLFLTTSLAIYGLMRKGKINYQMALELYAKGGGGFNVYQKLNGQSKRVFAIDYHPFWDKNAKESVYKLHYHRGDSKNQMKKHRPYEGGW